MAIDLVTRRFERMEKAQRETTDRLGKVEETLGRVVEVLEAHSRHFERTEDALIGISERVDRLTAAISRGRTQDLVRLDEHERPLHALEKSRQRRKR